MPRRRTNVDDLRTLRGFNGVAEAIFEFHPTVPEDREQILQELGRLHASAVIRGIAWLAIADGREVGSFYGNRDAAIAAVKAARRGEW